MFPWNSLEELQNLQDKLEHIAIVAGLIAAVIVAIYAITLRQISKQIESLKDAKQISDSPAPVNVRKAN